MVDGCRRDEPVAVVTSCMECNVAEDARTRRRCSTGVNMAIEKRVRETDKHFTGNSGLTLATRSSTSSGKICQRGC